LFNRVEICLVEIGSLCSDSNNFLKCFFYKYIKNILLLLLFKIYFLYQHIKIKKTKKINLKALGALLSQTCSISSIVKSEIVDTSLRKIDKSLMCV
jgi:hypothetical protein